MLRLLACFCLLTASCRSEADEAGGPPEPLPETAPRIQSGEHLYAVHCLGCHQADGEGVPSLYPPLADAGPWLLGDPERAVQIVLHGMQGELRMNDAVYNQVMPPFNHLSDAEIAALVTYARQSWGNEASAVTAEDVARIRRATADRTRPWTPDELE